MIEKIISGGQIGADRAALKAARYLKIPTGGTAPKGFRTLLGLNPELGTEYGLVEHHLSQYPPRTEQNVLNSDGTIRIAADFYTRGELLTKKLCVEHGKPCLDVKVRAPASIGAYNDLDLTHDFIVDNNIEILNVAGNAKPEIEAFVFWFVIRLIGRVNHIREANEFMLTA